MKGILLATGVAAAIIVAGAEQQMTRGAAPVEKHVPGHPVPGPYSKYAGGGFHTVGPVNRGPVGVVHVGGVVRGPAGGIYAGYGVARGPNGGVVVRGPAGGIYGGFRPGYGVVGAAPSVRVYGGGYYAGRVYMPYRPAYYGYYYARPSYAPYSVRNGSVAFNIPLFAGYSSPIYLPQDPVVAPTSGSQFGIVRSSASESKSVRTPANDSGTARPSAETGLRITDLKEGGVAKQVDLRVGDVILGLGKTRTQTFEDLQAALAASNEETDIIFINGENGKVEKLPIKPVDGKIGATVISQDLE